jgi:hypothetical protein
LSTQQLVSYFGDLVMATVRAARGGKPIRFADLKRPDFETVMGIVEEHHQGAIFGRKR